MTQGNLVQAIFLQPILAIITVIGIGLLIILSFSSAHERAMRGVALFASLAALTIGLIACLIFDKASLGFQFIERLDLLPAYNLTLTLGVDGLGFLFTLLTLFVFPICFLASWSVQYSIRQFLTHLLIMELLLVLTFTTTDLLYFFIFFESLLIPMFMLIGNWGARERKIKAAYYFFLYTLFGSLFMLFGLFYLYFLTGSMNYSTILNSALTTEQQQLIWFCFFLAFAVKMPLFPVHIWLPEAHVEAPTVGSMLLASLLLKLGGYGFLRFSIDMLKDGAAFFAPFISLIALLGVIYGSLSTIRQIDMKRVIAYSSVAHMNLVMLGLFSYSQQGLEGAVYLMVAHGVVSTALFFAVGVLYDRHHTRLFRYYGGVVLVMPLFATAFFAFTLANMSFPGTSNFLGELLIFVGLFNKNSFVLIFASSGIVLAAIYSIWLYNRVCFGTLKTKHINRFSDLNLRETAVFAVLLIPMLLLGLISNIVLDFTHLGIQALLLVPVLTSASKFRVNSSYLKTGYGKREYMSGKFYYTPSDELVDNIASFRKLRLDVNYDPANFMIWACGLALVLPEVTFYLHSCEAGVKWLILGNDGITYTCFSYVYLWGGSLCTAIATVSFIFALLNAMRLWYATIRLSSRLSRHIKHIKKLEGTFTDLSKRQYLGMVAKAWFDIQISLLALTSWLYVSTLFLFVFLLNYTLFGVHNWNDSVSEAFTWLYEAIVGWKGSLEYSEVK